jgi:hypothetical protein
MPAPALGRRLVVKLKQRDAPDGLQASDRHQSQREQLRAAVRAIQSASDTPATLEELFSAVENAVVDNEGHALHTLLGDECQRKAAADVAALAAGVALDSTTFLQHVVRLWEEYSSQLSLIRCDAGGCKGVRRPCCQQALAAAAVAAASRRQQLLAPCPPARLALPVAAAGRCSCTWTEPTLSAIPAPSACFSWACGSCAASSRRCHT